MISGGSKPQGLAYHPATDALYIASGGDGTWRSSAAMITQRWRESPWARMRTTSVWMRSRTKYGHGGLAVIDVTSRRKIAEIDLKTHPEGFQLDQANNRIFVNDPTNQAIVVVDRAAGKEMARWPTGDGGNFPMALYPKAEHVVVAFRNPARLAAYSIADGAAVANVELCADADDVFVDAKRERVYVSCGDGHLDVFDARGNAYRRIGHLVTQLGARTSLFVPELNLLFIAARATSSEPAAIWVFRSSDANNESLQ